MDYQKRHQIKFSSLLIAIIFVLISEFILLKAIAVYSVNLNKGIKTGVPRSALFEL